MKYLIVYVACMILTSWMSVSDAVRERFFFESIESSNSLSSYALLSIHIKLTTI